MKAALDYFGIDESTILGAGGEANVYALDDDRVVRIHKPGTSESAINARVALLVELDTSGVDFAIPEVLDFGRVGDFVVVVEKRLPGRSLDKVLAGSPPGRDELIRAYLDAANSIGDIELSRFWYGDLIAEKPIRTDDFPEYLRARAQQNLQRAGDPFDRLRADDFDMPLDGRPSLVHMDVFPGNVLVEDGRISAVIDFSVVAVMGDRRLDPLAAVAYLDSLISPSATDEDRRQAAAWLDEQGLGELLGPARRWLAAFWSAASGDVELHRWCRDVLLG